ncbi:MAG: hypothetical protein MUP26_04410, partial [Desulfobulbaceae bacterium]|nr:hypothetical protein [Desulfobulbaceae bacterium]
MGKADAESTLIYAHAYEKGPEFYSFIKSLDVYDKTMDKESSLLLSTDSDFLKYFKGYSAGAVDLPKNQQGDKKW